MGAPKERYDRDLTAVRSRINFAGYLTDFGDMVVKICYGKELSHQSLTGLREFCKRLSGLFIFLTRPISLVLILLILGMAFFAVILPKLKKKAL